MHLFAAIRKQILQICQSTLPKDIQTEGWLDAVAVELPKDIAHGDMATNAAMVLAKKAGQNPKQLAESLIVKIKEIPDVIEASVAGPGFINMRLKPEVWQKQIGVILDEQVGYGNSGLGKQTKVNVEYVSANPTGPMHIGHARGAVVGDALARLLQKAGYDVTKEYYINDAGAQIEKLAKSAFLRYREACGEHIGAIPEGYYPGDYLIGVGEGLRHQYRDKLLSMPDDERLPIVWEFAVEAMMVMIKNDLHDLGIEHDVFTSEKKELRDSGHVKATLDELAAKDLIYRGILEPPKGKTPEDWEQAEQTLFRASQFGDDSDRPVIKSNGDYTYFAGDVAYTDHKLKRDFNRLIMILGADHGGYVKRMQALVYALSNGKATIEVILCQLVKFLDNGEPVKMSKRSGTFTTVRDVVDAVGKDVVRFIMLTRKPEQPLDFDLAKVTEQSKDNPVFYVQYAHARCKSLLRLAREEMPEAVQASENPEEKHLSMLASTAELGLIKRLASWPRTVESAALAGEAHRIAYFLQDIAAEFHAFWNLGNDDISLRFIQKDAIDKTVARLAMARAVAFVIASGLQVLGVEPVEEMR
ncbi:MAG: arginine--tRNA ligase [Rickettsiales bacterium]